MDLAGRHHERTAVGKFVRHVHLLQRRHHCAAVALGHVTREYPNKLDHILTGPEDVLGPRALAGTFNANLLLAFLIGSVSGISMAANVLIAQAVGARDSERMQKSVGASITLLSFISVTIAVVGALLELLSLEDAALDQPLLVSQRREG